MNDMINALNWFEIPVDDFERARQFYSRIFAYEMPAQDMGKLRMGFLPGDPGRGVGGAIVHGESYVPSSEGALVYLNGGEDLSTVLNRITDAGGVVLLGKTEITPDIGFMALFADSEGNRVGLHSPH